MNHRERPPSVIKSCLVAKLSAYAELSPEDQRLLARLEESERDLRKDQLLRRTGQPVEELYVVKCGWLTSFSVMEDGRRQLLKLFYPGDIVDLSEASLERANHDIKCVTAATLCPFPKDGLKVIFSRSPRLTALLFAISVREAQQLLDRIRAIGRFSAYERVCYLLLEISDRLRLTEKEVDDESFRLLLTQGEVADLLGLTNVYVSKTLARVERDGLIRRQGSRIVILDRPRMSEIAEFRQAGPLQTSWFPALGALPEPP